MNLTYQKEVVASSGDPPKCGLKIILQYFITNVGLQKGYYYFKIERITNLNNALYNKIYI